MAQEKIMMLKWFLSQIIKFIHVLAVILVFTRENRRCFQKDDIELKWNSK